MAKLAGQYVQLDADAVHALGMGKIGHTFFSQQAFVLFLVYEAPSGPDVELSHLHIGGVLPDNKDPDATRMDKAAEGVILALEHPTGLQGLLEAAPSDSAISVPPEENPTPDSIPEVEISRLSSIVVGGEEFLYMHDLEKTFALRMDECFALLDCHGRARIDATKSHAEENLLPLGDTLVDTVQMAQAMVAEAAQDLVTEVEIFKQYKPYSLHY